MIESLTQRDEAETVWVLAQAFRDNPLNRAVIRSDDPASRTRSNEYGMQALVPAARRYWHVRIARRDGAVGGALVASPPGRFPLPFSGLVSRFRLVVGQGWRVSRRWGEVFQALELFHPIEPHWYLGTLGVAPQYQRCGLGRALLSDWIPTVDRDGVPAYLETDGEQNVPFYASVGFEVEDEVDVLGARIWRMRREAITARAASAQ